MTKMKPYLFQESSNAGNKPITLFFERRRAMKAKMEIVRAPWYLKILALLKSGTLLTAIWLLFGITFVVTGTSGSAWADDTKEFVPGALMVKFAESANVEIQKNGGGVTIGIHSLDILNQKYGVKDFRPVFSPTPKSDKGRTAYKKLGLDRIYRFETDKNVNVPSMAAEYGTNPNVEYAEPDYIGHGHFIPNDPNFAVQWGLYNTGLNPPPHPGTVDADVDATEAWDFYEPEHVVVLAILDTGVDLDHPDFWWTYPTNGVIWTNQAECSGIAGVDDDHNGYVDDCMGFDFVNGTYSGGVWYNDADGPQDDHGHGTVNAGIAGAITNNNVGVASLLGGPFNAHKIMAVKVIRSDNSFDYSTLIAGIYYAANNNASVINMSMGGFGYSSTLEAAVNYAWGQGCVLVASMGNCNSSTPQYPAAYTNTIAVGATDSDDSRCVPPDWDYMGYDGMCGSVHGSNYGSNIDVVAPGNWIYSTAWNDTYQYWAGTSMAAPLVSGLAAMIMSQSWPEPSPDSVRQIIQSTADDRVGPPSEDTPGWDQYYGWGRINAKRALGVPTPIYSEDFNDCDISDWTVYVNSGTFAATSSQWVSPSCGLHMYSQSGGYAYGMTPELNIDTTKDFTITTNFRLVDSNNHWFWVLSNDWVELVIDYGTNLRAYQGSQGPTLQIAALNTNQWYHIKTVVHPGASNYDIYLNSYYMATAKYPGTYLRYLRLGEFENGNSNYGEGYWDDLLVYGKKSYLCGDVNGDGVVDVGDVVYLINYLFKSGPVPSPREAGDVNTDGNVDVGDVVYLINYLFKGGPAPCAGKGEGLGKVSGLTGSSGHAQLSLVLNSVSGSVPAHVKISPETPNGMDGVSVEGMLDREVAGVQLEIEFNPHEVSLLDPILTPMTKNLQLFYSTREGIQKIGLVDVSGENLIPAGEGGLVNLQAIGDNLSSIKIKSATLVDKDALPLTLDLSGELKEEEDKNSASKPTVFSLYQNYPNPFNPETSIRYALPQDAKVKLVIYDVLGKKLKTLVNEHQSAGFKAAWWDGKDEEGNQAASGIYFYRLETENFSEVKKMMLVK